MPSGRPQQRRSWPASTRPRRTECSGSTRSPATASDPDATGDPRPTSISIRPRVGLSHNRRTMGFKLLLAGVGVVWVVVASVPASIAGELAGVRLPDQMTVEGRTLTLNGMGLREATILKVRVYVAGLYLVARSADASQIVASEEPKRLVLDFVRDVGRGSLVDAWNEGFAKSAGAGLTALQPRVATLNGWMSDMK